MEGNNVRDNVQRNGMSSSFDKYIYGILAEHVEIWIYNAKTVSFVHS
jgi:hypothetical protein